MEKVFVATHVMRPARVAAQQFFPDRKPWPEGVTELGGAHWSQQGTAQPHHSLVDPAKGYSARVDPGDWIVSNQFGERYVIRIDLFHNLYEPIK